MTDFASLGIKVDSRDVKNAIDVLNRLTPAADKAERSTKKVTTSFGSAAKEANALKSSILGLASAAFGAFSFIKLANEVLSTTRSFDSLNKSLLNISGSSTLAKKQMDFVAATSKELGLNMVSATQAYVGLTAAAKGTAIEGVQTDKIFKSVAKAMAALGKSSYDTQGALLAISQMMSKGTVQAEELRGQLGERLPGAFGLAAQAMGVTTAELGKMLERGQVLASDFLPKLARELDNTYSTARFDSIESSLNRISNAWDQLVLSIGEYINIQGRLKNIADRVTPDDALQAIEREIFRVNARSGRNANPKLLADLIAQRDAILDQAHAQSQLNKEYNEYDSILNKGRTLAEGQIAWMADRDKLIEDLAKKARKASELAAKSELSRAKSVKETISALQLELDLSTLSDKEKQFRLELYNKLKNARGGEIKQITDLMVAIDAQRKAREKQNDIDEITIQQANALDSLHDSAKQAQYLLALVNQLKAHGATNKEIQKRLDLERQVASAIESAPDLDAAKVREYVTARIQAEQDIRIAISGSADHMEAAYKRAMENMQDALENMFESVLNGSALDSFKSFAENIKNILYKAISQDLALNLQNLFNGRSTTGSFGTSLIGFGASLITSLFSRSSPTRSLSPASQNRQALGSGAMAISESLSRDLGFEYQSRAALEFNNSLDKLSSVILNAKDVIFTGISSFADKLASISVVSRVLEFFKPLTNLIGQGVSYITNIYNGLTSLVSGATATVTTVATAASEAATAASNASSSVSAIAGNVAVALAVIKLGYDLYSTITSDSLTNIEKATNSILAVSDALLTYGLVNIYNPAGWVALIAAAVTNVIGAVTQIIDKGFNMMTVGRLFGGVLSDIIGGLFGFGQAKPAAYINNYNPSGDWENPQPYSYNQFSINDQPKKSFSQIGQNTPFGLVTFSFHNVQATADDMAAAFQGLLDVIEQVDVQLYNSINRIDEKFGETGRTMEFFNNTLSGQTGPNSFTQRQKPSGFSAGDALEGRYNFVFDLLSQSGSPVSIALKAWFDVLNEKFKDISKDNTVFILGLVDQLARNIEAFMEFPLSIVNLIGNSVKSISQGGTSQTVFEEINKVLGAYNLARDGLKTLGADADNERIGSFLANVNAIGFGVEDAAVNLLAYGIALKKADADLTDILGTVEAKLAELQKGGLSNTQATAFFGSFGLFADLFAEAGVAFDKGDLDKSANSIHELTTASVQVAKDVIDHAIADQQLTKVSRESAIATLVKSGAIDEATVAEAEYGFSIQETTKEILAQMGFVQQLGFITGQSLGEMSISADTWRAAAANVVNVFGDLETAMNTFDNIAQTFLTAGEYAQYSLDTVNRAIENMQRSSPDLIGITEESIRATVTTANGLENFINALATGNGEAAKQTVQYVQLIMQRIQAEENLANAVGQTTDIIDNSANALDSAFNVLSRSIDAQKRQLTDAYNAEAETLQKRLDSTLEANRVQRESAQELLNTITTVAQNIRAALGSTEVETTALTRARRLSAQSVLQSALGASNAGQSLADFPGLEIALADIQKPSEQLFSTFEDYARDQGRTAAVINNLANNADSQVSVAEQTLESIDGAAKAAQLNYDRQYRILTDTYNAEISRLDGMLEAARLQIEVLQGIDISVMTVVDAIESLRAALAGAYAAGGKEGALTPGVYSSSGGAQYFADTGTIVGKGGNAYAANDAVKWVTDTVNAGNAALVYAKAISEGISANSLDRLMGWSPGTSNQWAVNNRLPSFANGGLASGWALVGEQGPELVNFGEPSRVYTSSQTKAALAGDGTVEEIRQLREEQRAANIAIAQNTAAMARLFKRWDGDGLPAERVIA